MLKKQRLNFVRQFTLNKNAKNYFAEIEQVAINLSYMPPSIEPSANSVIQSRFLPQLGTAVVQTRI